MTTRPRRSRTTLCPPPLRPTPSGSETPSQPEAPFRMSSRVGVLGLCLVLAACPGPDAEARQVNDRDTMTARQRDSVTATLPIPGARGVGNALDAAEKANARAARHDALLGGSRN